MLFIAPCILMLLVFVYVPLVQNFVFSFESFSAFSQERAFIGLQNYKTLFGDKVVGTAIRNNIYYAVISVIFQVFGGLILASALEDNAFRRISPLFRTTFFLPVLVSMTVICLL